MLLHVTLRDVVGTSLWLLVLTTPANSEYEKIVLPLFSVLGGDER